MKKIYGIILLLTIILFPAVTKAAGPQGGQFFTFGNFPLSFRTSFFSPFLNPASGGEYDRLDFKTTFGTLSNENLIGAGIGIPTLLGSFDFNFIYFTGDTGLTELIGGRIGYTREIARNFFFGMALKGGTVSGNGDSGFLINADAGIFTRTKAGKIPLNLGLSFVNIGLPASLGESDSFQPMGLRLEAQPEFDFSGKNFTTSPFISILSGFYPFGNTLSLGLEQQVYFVNLGAGTTFDLNGENYQDLGPLYFSAKAEKDFGKFTIGAQYSLYPLADFNGDDTKELKNLFEINIKMGSVDREGPAIGIEPYNLVEKDQNIYLSPNQDNLNDNLSFGLQITDPSQVQEWTFEVKDARGNVIFKKGNQVTRKDFSMSAFSNILKKKKQAFHPFQIFWPVVNNEGQQVPDGTYYFTVSAKDFKGNTASVGNPVTRQAQKIIVDTVPPSLDIVVANRAFSPNNDGKQDTLTIQHKNISEEGKWYLEIRSNGSVVYRDNWMGKPKESFVWDGKNEDGKSLPDGNYDYAVWAEDKAGNKFNTVLNNIVIDTRSPVVRAKAEENYFSPNNDRIKDTVVVEQEVNKPGEWTGEILNEKNEIVRSFDWKPLPPKTLEWDGKNNRGQVLPDGKYTYRLKGIDQAGNETRQNITTFIVDNTPPAGSIQLTETYFSPNNDGEKDFIVLNIKETSEEVFWKGEVLDAKNQPVKTLIWNGRPPEAFQWDGLNQEGYKLPDGNYRFVLTSEDRAGNSYKKESRPIVLDTTPPLVQLDVEHMIFSPNNDGRKDQTEMKIDIKDAVESRLEILDSSNQNVLTQTLPPQSGSYIWDGKNKKNETVADGSYKAVLKVKDQAGNVSTDEKLVTVLNLETQISLTGNRNLLNPKNQDINHIRFKSALPRLELIEKITMVTLDKDKDEVIEKQHPKPEEKNFEFSFNGLEDDDDYLEDGEYTQKIIVEYTNGDVLESNTVPFRMDQTGPEASLAISPSIFSPDGDGENDILKIDLKANDPTGINTWYIVIEDRFKDIFKSFKGQRNIPDNIQWDGRSNKGELTDSAEDYIIYAIVSDNAGNLTTTEKIHFNTDILVIKTDRGYKIRISNIHFDLNKAELKPQAVNILNKVADKLKKFPDYKVRIEGHADSTGRESWNEKLSLLRAESVRNYLVDEKDLAPEMFITEGFGSKIPLYPNDTPKNRAKNRRVEFILIK